MNSLIFHQPGKPPHIQIIGRVISGNEIIHPMVEKNRRYYELIVHDHGIGFEQKFENQIFQLFKKLHNRTEYPGSGIGLTLCKKIVENHKGFIIARGKPNEGSSFYCYFPVIENL
jgi:light-regulated signal transduction histidine kinase (bacteriophytochrome)